jgi:uncharacterized protein YxjI
MTSDSTNGHGGTRYMMHKRMFSIGQDFWIETGDGHPAFKVDGRALSLRSMFVLEDSTGAEVYRAQRRLLPLKATMEIERGDAVVATIRKAIFVMFGERFEIDLADGSQLEGTGSISNHEYRILRGDELIASISKQWFTVPQTFGIEIAADQDDALLIAISACLDEMSERG